MNINLRKAIPVVALLAALGTYAGRSISNDEIVQKNPSRPTSTRVIRNDNDFSIKGPTPIYDRFHQSPDYKPGRSRCISEIVLHTTEGSGSGAENWLTTKDKTSASAHYLIMENGEVVSLVKDTDTAYHCRGHNSQSVGIEFAGHYDRDLNPSQITAGQRVIGYLMSNYNIKKSNIKAHSDLDPSRRKDPGKRNMEAILSGIN